VSRLCEACIAPLTNTAACLLVALRALCKPLVVSRRSYRRSGRYCTADLPCELRAMAGDPAAPLWGLLPGLRLLCCPVEPLRTVAVAGSIEGSRSFPVLHEARSPTFPMIRACAASHACQSFAVAGVPGNAWCYDLGTEAACAWLTQRRARRQRVLRAAGILWVRTAPCPGRRDSLNALPSFHRLCKATVRGDRAWCGL